ncbi:hypothetical protein ACIF6L_31445 [Kitasatospora sp. NPDC086009]|uniref:hypothetical protein n=1 Tax=unclassified Kitasatospora TaxID=2633591 RepID=UPI0037C8CDA0
MSVHVADHSWLPDHQLHVVATLAHVDQTIERVVRLIHDYTERGTLVLDNVVDGDREHVTVTAIVPLPEAIPRLVADALTQLRAALEHTLYAEIEHQTPRPLTDREARGIEMPAFTDAAKFDVWLSDGRRKHLPSLQSSALLAQRIRMLQPFQDGDADSHPLRLLTEYTNLAKHRTPAVAATRLGAVHPDYPHPEVTVALPLKLNPQPGDGLPLRPGDILASAPKGVRIGISITPSVALQRPHTAEWHIAALELGDLEDWVRTTALPILLTGSRNVTPLPPHLDITVGHEDLRQELRRAGTLSAARRAKRRLAVASARSGLVDLLTPYAAPTPPQVIGAWLSTMDDTTVLKLMDRLVRAAATSPHASIQAVDALLAELDGYKASAATEAG